MGKVEQRMVELITLKEKGLGFCTLCKDIKPLDQFNKQVSRKRLGYKPRCISCNYEHYKKQYNEKALAYYYEDKNRRREYKRKYTKEKATSEIDRIRRNFKNKFKQNKISMTYKDIFHFSMEEIKNYLESKFTHDMNWDNYGTAWVIDHIIPTSAFNWSNKKHLQWCWDIKNLQAISPKNNLDKADKIYGESIRILKRNKSLQKLNELIGYKLEELGITTAQEYIDSLQDGDKVIFFIE